MLLPDMKKPQLSQRNLTKFLGYNATISAGETEFNEMQNLWSGDFPLLSVRPQRGTIGTLTAPRGLLGKDAICYVDGGTLYLNAAAVPGITLQNEGIKQLVSMGAYLVIFPDKKYVNTKDLTDCGSLENQTQTATDTTFSLCRKDGTLYSGYVTSETEPTSPADGALWVDTSGEKDALKQYSASSAMWVQIPTVYVRIGAAGIGTGFQKGDGVTLSGCDKTDYNASFVLQDVGDNYLTVIGLVDQAYTQPAANVMTARRNVPDMDFICESGNRLWGCKYGIVDGKTVNEIYACKLGDFKNWNCFAGLSTDSYAASRGSDGPFTGAIAYQGYPLFFKEECLEKVYPSGSGAHQIVTLQCRGVQRGCWRSLQLVGETLLYKSRDCVCAYGGSQPASISAALGETQYSDARAGAIGSRYLISMQETGGAWSLLCYDTAKGLWHREDASRVLLFAPCDGELYYIDEDTKALRTVMGSVGTKEGPVAWSAVTGMIGMDAYQQKAISRISLRGKLEEGSSLKLWAEYDSDGVWHEKGTISGSGLRSFLLPVTPRRCDHARLKLTGTGAMQLFSIHEAYEKGSDVL